MFLIFRENIQSLRNVSGLLGGILVTYVNVSDTAEQLTHGFSPDAACPNGEHGRCTHFAR